MSKNNSFESSRNKKNKNAVIFDLDGTLANTEDPNANHKVNHDGFRDHANKAEAFPEMVEKLKSARDKGKEVVILTARSAHYRSDTKKWLNKNGISYDALVMRPIGDDRRDKKVKKSLLKEDILPYFNVTKAYDDKKKNVKMFRKEGIKAKQVND